MSTINFQIENLDYEFEQLLDQYKNTIQQLYLLNKTNDNTMIQLPNREVIGGTVISYETLPSVNNCQALCSSNKNCCAANYDTLSENCVITSGNVQSGNININPSTNSKISILSKQNYLILQLKSINNQLYQILNQSTILVQNVEPQTREQYNQVIILKNKLVVKQQLLTQQTQEIDKLYLDFNDLQNEYNISKLTVNQAHLYYIVWSICMTKSY